MVKLKKAYGYDIYGLTKAECDKNWYEYPCFCAVYEGEDLVIGREECSTGNLEELLDWCKEDRVYAIGAV